MSATGDLRRMLDERGVEWMPSVWSAKDETFYKVGEVGYLATELSSGKMKVCIEGYPTPAQAIAATIGTWKLTAEQVMAIAGKHQPDYCSDTHVCFDWQAIADELNVMMGTGTCKADETDLIPFVRANGDVSEVDYIRVMECSSCGGTFEHINGSYEFCPRCGRRIEVAE